MVSRNTTLVLSLQLRIGPACDAGLSAGMRREHVPPKKRKKERHHELQNVRQSPPEHAKFLHILEILCVALGCIRQACNPIAIIAANLLTVTVMEMLG